MGRLTDWFIPEHLNDEDGIARRRARIALKTVFFLIIWGPITAGLYWFGGSTDGAWAVGLTTILAAATPLVLKRTGSLAVAGNWLLVILYALLMWLSVIFGGLDAPPLSWLLLVPVLAVLFHGLETGAIWMGIVSASWLAIAAADLSGFPFAQQLSPTMLDVLRAVEVLGLGSVVFVVFMLKDSLQGWLLDKVRVKEAETRAVLETAPDGILTVDSDGEVLTSNKAAARIFGRDHDEVVGRSIQELVSSLDAEALDGAVDEAFGATQEHTGLNALGGSFPAEIAFGTLAEADRQGVVLVLRDITERVEAAEQLRRARDEAVEANRAKSSFLANMSHELRTPLNAVIGYSEMLMEEIGFVRQADESGAEIVGQFVPDLTRIRTAGKHLLSIINDILDLSKIEAGKMQLHVELFDVRELLDDIAGTVRPLADKNDNTLRIDVGEEVRFMRSDATKVRQILFNLLSNACKFTEAGSVEIGASLDADNEQVVFEVRDTGIGMSDDQLDQVFEAFTQADASTTRKFGGTGLGLTITSYFCALLGGEITVESAPNEGTEFTVRLAVELDEESEAVGVPSSGLSARSEVSDGLPDQPDPQDPDRDTVLVIDDDPSVRDLLSRVLQREGFHVVTAASGSEGLLLAEQLVPSAITLDVMMPSMDGWTLLSKLKEHPELAPIPVVMVTIVSEASRGYALGADDYLIKPVDRGELVEIMDGYRRRRADPSADGGQILLVEDDEPTRTLIGRTLRDDGWTVTEARDGRVGLDLLDQVEPDLVLLDLMMPNMDGFEFLRRLRNQPAWRDVPVVVVTAKELTREDRQQLRAAASEVLTKGGREQDKLLDEVRRQVRRATRASQSAPVP